MLLLLSNTMYTNEKNTTNYVFGIWYKHNKQFYKTFYILEKGVGFVCFFYIEKDVYFLFVLFFAQGEKNYLLCLLLRVSIIING